eukprot:scaffold151817_cov24-Tisochrysis_lutea.AAC.2
MQEWARDKGRRPAKCGAEATQRRWPGGRGVQLAPLRTLTASNPALAALWMATVATGMPLGICSEGEGMGRRSEGSGPACSEQSNRRRWAFRSSPQLSSCLVAAVRPRAWNESLSQAVVKRAGSDAPNWHPRIHRRNGACLHDGEERVVSREHRRLNRHANDWEGRQRRNLNGRGKEADGSH